MFSTDDTIVAVATPPGRGGLGVVRLSGAAAQAVALRLVGPGRAAFEPRRATFARVRAAATGNGPDAPGPAFDQVVCTFFPGPQSFTGEDVVEVSAHGSPVVLARIVEEAVRAGARLARPGEFTLRAYLAGRLDLVQAEAVADLVEAVTPAQARLAFDQLEGTLTGRMAMFEHTLFEHITRLEASLDFPEEGYHFGDPTALAADLAALEHAIDEVLGGAGAGRLVRDGAVVVLAGRPNVGKSSLFNALLGTARAIVTSVPGTTRDLLTERCDLAGIPVTLVDTAGVREPGDLVEREGVDRARRAAEAADLRLIVIDRSEPLTDEDEVLLRDASAASSLVVLSKGDLRPSWGLDVLPEGWRSRGVEVSALTGSGVGTLCRRIVESLGASEPARDVPTISNLRHIRLLERVREAVARGRGVLVAGASEEFVLADLREASEALAEVTGRRTTEDVLEAIFARFCIGK
jgi:tRNA modification GTPase